MRLPQASCACSDGELPREEDGTKVFTDVLEAGSDTLFPLQNALGYEIYQSLFIGPNCLIVEGVSDLLYIQVMSDLLRRAGREPLDARWTITPVGGSDKVPTFVALTRSQKGLLVATLIDFQKKDRQSIENMYKRKLLKKNRVLTYADFTGTTEADVEDMLEPSLYLDLVNAEYANELTTLLTPALLTSQAPRIDVRIKEHLAANPLKNGAKEIGHYGQARRLADSPHLYSIAPSTLDRFEAAFKAANALLDKP